MTDRRAAAGPLPELVEAVVAAGVDWVQVRERDLEGGALLALVDAVRTAARRGAAARGGGVRVLVNRRVDVALAAGADGVHLGFDALPPERARALLPAGAALGVSTHSPLEAETAAKAGANYVHLAPIFEPLSKAPSRPALGLAALADAAAFGLPVLAQGGLTAARADAAVAAGAAGVAVTGAILSAPDPPAAAAALRRALGTRHRS